MDAEERKKFVFRGGVGLFFKAKRVFKNAATNHETVERGEFFGEFESSGARIEIAVDN